jgi:hypothetical protein
MYKLYANVFVSPLLSLLLPLFRGCSSAACSTCTQTERQQQPAGTDRSLCLFVWWRPVFVATVECSRCFFSTPALLLPVVVVDIVFRFFVCSMKLELYIGHGGSPLEGLTNVNNNAYKTIDADDLTVLYTLVCRDRCFRPVHTEIKQLPSSVASIDIMITSQYSTTMSLS